MKLWKISVIVSLSFIILAIFAVVIIAGARFFGTVAIIDIDGIIIRDDNGIFSNAISPDDVRDMVDRAKFSNAAIFRINSPGGSVVASKEIFEIIKNLEIPKICLMQDIATSGALWIAMACDYIIADSLTITGSIGASASYLEFSELLSKYGVEAVNLTSGKFKDIASPFRNITREEREILLRMLEDVELEFKNVISKERNLPIEIVDGFSDGRIFLGKTALNLGLLDELGNLDTAIKKAEEMSNEKLRRVYIKKRKALNPFQAFLSGILFKGGFWRLIPKQKDSPHIGGVLIQSICLDRSHKISNIGPVMLAVACRLLVQKAVSCVGCTSSWVRAMIVFSPSIKESLPKFLSWLSLISANSLSALKAS